MLAKLFSADIKKCENTVGTIRTKGVPSTNITTLPSDKAKAVLSGRSVDSISG